MTITFDSPLFLDTEDIERRVRSNDPDTSWLAASITPEDAAGVRDFIVLFLARRPDQTDDQIFDAYKASGGTRTAQRVRTARAELSNPKHGTPEIIPSGIGTSAAGGKSTTWKLA